MVRIARFGRLYKLVKLTRLLRVLKIFKEQNKLVKKLTEFLKIGIGFERLFFFIMIFMMVLHIIACLNLIIAALYSKEIEVPVAKEDWEKYNIKDESNAVRT
jgi:hypothetical protein